MATVDLGTRIIVVNQSLLRKDYDLLAQIDIPIRDDPQAKPASESSPIQQDAEQLVEDGSASYAHVLWQSVSHGKLDFLELFAGSARLSQCCVLAGLDVGPPIDLRTGFDLNKATGQKQVMDIILNQNPEIVHMAPLCCPWSQLSNSKPEWQRIEDKKTCHADGSVLCPGRLASN